MPGEKMAYALDAWHAFIHDIRPSPRRGDSTTDETKEKNDSQQKLPRFVGLSAEQQ